MIYNVLPAVIQNRIAWLPSIRRSISDSPGQALRPMSISSTTEIPPPATPPGYTERPGSARSNRNSVVSTEGDNIIRDDVSEHAESSISTPPPFTISETTTGINWKYANQGISLVSQSYQESHALARRADNASTILTRQLYMHGMTYLLRGLPSELSQEEALSLQAAAPQSIASLQSNPSTQTLVPMAQNTTVPQGPPADTSILHRITAIVVFHTFVLVQFLLPYIKLFISRAYRFERQHKLTQRLVNNGIMVADALRRSSLELSHTICQMNDGKVGQAINDLTLWLVRGLTGGLQQGITDGVTMFSDERPAGS